MFELSCDALGAALTAVREVPDVIDAAIFGDKLHILLREGREAPNFSSLLQQKGVVAGALRRIVPSLEDVFVQLVSRNRVQEVRA